MNLTSHILRVPFLILAICLMQSANARGRVPVTCNPSGQYNIALANGGQAVKNFNGYDRWDSMLEISNADGRQERFWLDNNGDGSGRIRHTWATTACTGFAWARHEDFAGGYAKEMVAARTENGNLIVAHIGRDGGFNVRVQLSPGGAWTSGWFNQLNNIGPRPFIGANEGFYNLSVGTDGIGSNRFVEFRAYHRSGQRVFFRLERSNTISTSAWGTILTCKTNPDADCGDYKE